MHVGTDPETIDLTPGTTTGALYDGMTADGSSVYFTTSDPLATASDQDTDTSADIFRADVSSGSAALTRVSVGNGGAGNSDACDPVPNATDEHWNAVSGGAADCGAVAIGGGGGVASDSRGRSTSSAPSSSTAAAMARPDAPNLYVDRARLGAALRRHPRVEPDGTATRRPNTTPTTTASARRRTRSSSPSTRPGGPSDGDIYVADNGSAARRPQVRPGRQPDHELGRQRRTRRVDDGEGACSDRSRGVAVGPDGKLYVGVLELLQRRRRALRVRRRRQLLSEHGVEGAIQPFGISVDGAGNVFYVGYYEVVERFDGVNSTEVSGLTEGQFGEPIAKSGLAVDPNSGDLYVGIGGESMAKFSFDGLGRVIQNGPPCNSRCIPTATFGADDVSGASGHGGRSLQRRRLRRRGQQDPALRLHRAPRRRAGHGDRPPQQLEQHRGRRRRLAVYANTKIPGGANVAAFAPLTLAPEPRTDNPAIIDAVNDAGARHTADFQVTPTGDDAAFPSAISLTGYDNGGHSEIFRYDPTSDTIACASCNPTGARAIGDATMAVDGLSLTDDGRVFFNSDDALAPRDLDNRQDAYEWNGEDAAADLDRGQPVRLQPAERQRRRHGRLLLHPRHASSRRTRTGPS